MMAAAHAGRCDLGNSFSDLFGGPSNPAARRRMRHSDNGRPKRHRQDCRHRVQCERSRQLLLGWSGGLVNLLPVNALMRFASASDAHDLGYSATSHRHFRIDFCDLTLSASVGHWAAATACWTARASASRASAKPTEKLFLSGGPGRRTRDTNAPFTGASAAARRRAVRSVSRKAAGVLGRRNGWLDWRAYAVRVAADIKAMEAA